MTSTDRIIKLFYDMFCFGFIVSLIFTFVAAMVTMEIVLFVALIFQICLVPWIFKKKDVEERPAESQRADEQSTIDEYEAQIRVLQERIKELEARLKLRFESPNRD